MQTLIYLNPNDPVLCELEQRIYDTGLLQKTITYSDLARGLSFRPRNTIYVVTMPPWPPVNRAIISDYLSHISLESYKQHQFMASALAVADDTGTPSRPFFQLARSNKWLKPGVPEFIFWVGEIDKAHKHFAHSKRPVCTPFASTPPNTSQTTRTPHMATAPAEEGTIANELASASPTVPTSAPVAEAPAKPVTTGSTLAQSTLGSVDRKQADHDSLDIDTCLLSGEPLTIEEALERRDEATSAKFPYPEFRCDGCGHKVIPHKGGIKGAKPHFEHAKANPFCPYLDKE